MTPTSADIFWSPPDDNTGRTDLYYNISYSAFAQSKWFYPAQDHILDTHYTLEDLVPCTLYFVRLTAENGVSSQAGGPNQRSVVSFLKTTERGELGK